MRTVGIFVAMAVSVAALSPRVAGADTARAWTAARAALPADATLVIGVDLAAIQKSELFAAVFPKLRARPGVGEMFDLLKDHCKLDPLAVVQSAVVAMADNHTDGAVYLAVTGVDRAGLAKCIEAVNQGNGAKVTVQQDGNLTQLTKDNAVSYAGWVGKDVIVMSLHPEDKPALVKWMGGKGAFARSGLSATLTKVNKAAALWSAGDVVKELEPGATAKTFYGAFTFAGGNLGADLHVVMQDAAQAAQVKKTTTDNIAAFKLKSHTPLGGMMDKISVATSGNEVVVKATLVEKLLVGAIAPLLGKLDP